MISWSYPVLDTIFTHSQTVRDSTISDQIRSYGRNKCSNIRGLKQQRRQRLRKRQIKSEFALLQTLSRLFHLVQFVRCGRIFLEFNSKGLYQDSEKEKGSRRLAFTFSTKREIRHFHVVVVHQRQTNVLKRVMHVQSCCFANLRTYCFFAVLVAVVVVT